MRKFLAVVPLVLSGCASIAQGGHQDVTIQTVPSDAECTINRDDRALAKTETTPATVSIDRSGDYLVIECGKEGYLAQEDKVNSSINTAFWYNFYWLAPVITFPVTIVGVIVDVSTGSYHQYDTPIEITLKEASSTPAGNPAVITPK